MLLEVAKSAGFSQGHTEELARHWHKWEEAITGSRFAPSKFTLTAFPGRPASAVSVLSSFLQRKEVNMSVPEFALTEVGTQVFRDALQILKGTGGRRDATVKFLEDQQAIHGGTDRDEIRMVKAIFFHYMFAVIAQGNNAVAEHSDSTGQDDSYALETNYFDKVESFEEDTMRFDLGPRIVSGLGELHGYEYERLRKAIVPHIRRGIESFKKSVNESMGNGDLSKLNDAFQMLEREVSTSVHFASAGAKRKIAWGAGGAVVGTAVGAALEIQFGGQLGDAAKLIGSGVGALIGAATEPIATGLTNNFSGYLFKKSLVRATLRELTTDDPEAR